MNHLTGELVVIRDHAAFCTRPGVMKRDPGETARPAGSRMTRFLSDAGSYRVQGRQGKRLCLPLTGIEEKGSSGRNEAFYLPGGGIQAGRCALADFSETSCRCRDKRSPV